MPALLRRGISNQAGNLGIAVGCTIAIVAGNLAEPQIVKWIIDEAILGPRQEVWLRAIPLWIGIFLSQHVFLAIQVALIRKAEEFEAARLRMDIFQGLTETHLLRGQTPDISDIIVSHTKDVEDIKQAWTTIPLLTVFYLLTITGALIASLFISFQLTAYIVLITLAVATVTLVASRRATSAAQRCRDTVEAFVITLRTAAQNLRLVQVFNVHGYFRGRLEARSGVMMRQNMQLGVWQWSGSSLGDLASFCTLAGVLVFGGAEVVAGEMTIGVLFAFFLYVNLASQSLRDLLKQLVPYGKAKVAAHRLEPLLAASDTEPVLNSAPLGAIQSVSVRRVSFRYGSARELLRDCSCTFEAGAPNLVIGANGAGKTTLLNLLGGFLAPQSGAIFVNGRDIASIDRRSYWEKIGLVTAEDLILDISVADNLLIARQDATSGELVRVLSELRIVDENTDYDRFLASEASSLSSGTKRKLAIARACLRAGTLYLFDEPSANLDDASCESLCGVLNRIAKSAVVIVTSQDPRLRFESGQTYQLDNGALLPQELVAQ